MKKGFTLAEALITLSIIGIVSAISLPSLVTSNRKKVYGATLATAVDNMEKVFNAMMTSVGANWLEDTAFYDAFTDANASAARAAGELGKFIDITAYGTTASQAAEGYETPLHNLGSGTSGFPEGGYYFRTKPGMLLHIVPQEARVNANGNAEIASERFALNKQIFLLTIDINGAQDPNTIGRDVFKYAIGADGNIFPLGGLAWNQYSGQGLWNQADTNSCCSCDVALSSDTPGWGCAGRMADNGYKMDY